MRGGRARVGIRRLIGQSPQRRRDVQNDLPLLVGLDEEAVLQVEGGFPRPASGDPAARALGLRRCRRIFREGDRHIEHRLAAAHLAQRVAPRHQQAGFLQPLDRQPRRQRHGDRVAERLPRLHVPGCVQAREQVIEKREGQAIHLGAVVRPGHAPHVAHISLRVERPVPCQRGDVFHQRSPGLLGLAFLHQVQCVAGHLPVERQRAAFLRVASGGQELDELYSLRTLHPSHPESEALLIGRWRVERRVGDRRLEPAVEAVDRELVAARVKSDRCRLGRGRRGRGRRRRRGDRLGAVPRLRRSGGSGIRRDGGRRAHDRQGQECQDQGDREPWRHAKGSRHGPAHITYLPEPSSGPDSPPSFSSGCSFQ